MSADAPEPVPHLSRLYPVIHDLEPLLEYTEPFKLAETPAGGTHQLNHEHRGIVRRAVDLGALEKHDRGAESYRWTYRWNPAARQHLLEYLEGLDELPCGCRAHLPDTRDDPDGVISCKYCGEQYREAFFKDCVREKL